MREHFGGIFVEVFRFLKGHDMYFLQGLLLGIASMAPIGMQNLFVINSALTQTGWRTAMTVFVIIFFDMTLSLAAFFGMGALIAQSVWIRLFVLIVGGLLILYIGYETLRSVPKLERVDTDVPFYKVIYTAFLVTWVNPQALIDTSMMYGAFRAVLSESQGYAFLTGILVAAVIWFGGLALTVSIMSERIGETVLLWLNRICGAVILAYGVKLLYDGIMMAAEI